MLPNIVLLMQHVFMEGFFKAYSSQKKIYPNIINIFVLHKMRLVVTLCKIYRIESIHTQNIVYLHSPDEEGN